MSQRLHQGERGASAIMIAFTMVIIMGLAAIVIDGGRAFSERRQAQAGVDFASLAALQAATGANPAEAGAAEAIAVVAANLPGRALDWSTCTDPARPAEYINIATGIPCVSFTENFEQARVRLPSDAVDTSFGRLLGAAALNVRTTAEAEQNINFTADILPYTAGPGAAVCLFSNQAPQAVEPCSGPFSGFFGYLDVALYGSDPDELDNPWTCSQGTSNVRSAINIAKGADHIMNAFPPAPLVNDHADCANRSEDVNELVVQPGDPTQGSDDGLIHGVSGSINGESFGSEDGRLEHNPAWSIGPAATVRGFTLDNTPLWKFLVDTQCSWSGAITGQVDSHAEMEDCLDDWDPSDGSIFTLSLDDHKRFGAIPIFHVYPDGPGSYKIKEFAPLWIETLYFNCNASGPECKTIFSPGEMGGNVACPPVMTGDVVNCGHGHTQGQDDVEGVTGFRLDISMLHPDTQEFFPGQDGTREVALLK